MMSSYSVRPIVVLCLLVISIQLLAQKRTYTTERITGEAPTIDGLMNESAWDNVEWTGDFVQRHPYENQPPSEQTQFKILYDNDNLYVLIRAFDSSPDSIVKRMSRRDGFAGDWVEINIDSYHDKRTAFSFCVSAAGVKGDEAITNDDNWDSSWDPIWYTKTSIDELGWIAEMRIPLTQLRFGKQDHYTWGLQVNRRLFRKEEASSWQFISPQASGWVHLFGELEGINNIVPQKQRDLTPYAVARLENYEREEGNPYADGRDYSGTVGLDGKFGITNDLTLDFTINPDYGQVEADPSEVNLTTFETYFEERRAFFIEGKNILSHRIVGGGSSMSRDNLFYTRRIGRRPWYEPDTEDGEYMDKPNNTTILGAAKITGKTKNGWSIGLLESVTQEEVAKIAMNGEGRREEVVEPLTNYFTTRIEKDMNDANTQIGAMVTATNRNLNTPELKEVMHSSAYSGGINFQQQWKDKTYYFRFNLVGSLVQGSKEAIHETQTSSPHYFQRPDAPNQHVDSNRTSLSGHGGTLQIGKQGNSKVRYTMWVTWRSPELHLNDMGYQRLSNEIQQVFWLGYYQNDPGSFYRNFNLNFNQWYGVTMGLEKRYVGLNMNGHIQYKNYWCTGLGFSRDGISYNPTELRGGPSLLYDPYTGFWGHVGTDNRKRVRFVLMYSGGFNDHQVSKRNHLELYTEIQASDAFKISFSPGVTKRYNKAEYVCNIDDWTEDRYIRGKIDLTETSMTVRLTYNITPDFTIQYYGMPFVSAGKYSEFKYVNDPHAMDFDERFTSYTDEQITYNSAEEQYDVDETGDGNTDYSFDNKDFNFLDFNSNLVVRWEYRPGSTLYLVWNQNRSEDRSHGDYSFSRDSRDLFMNTYPSDVFLIKLSYRFGL